jgi:hypothetical protein
VKVIFDFSDSVERSAPGKKKSNSVRKSAIEVAITDWLLSMTLSQILGGSK